MANLLSAKANNTGDPTKTNVTPEMREGWNQYSEYLEKKGLAGDPRLNKEFGKKVFTEWAAKNPQYGLSLDVLPSIGKELADVKKNTVEAVNKGKIKMNKPVSEFNPTDVTNDKTKNRWWPGTEFTAQTFPTHHESIVDKQGKVLKEKTYGITAPNEDYKFKLNLGSTPISPSVGISSTPATTPATTAPVNTPISYNSAYLRQGIKMKKGGLIKGPGTSTSDEIPAMLSNGEYIVNADSVKKYGVKFLNKINGKAKKYADGGLVNLLQSKSRALVNKTDTTM